MSKINCGIFAVARNEYIKWLTNPRNIVFLVLVVFAKTLAIDPLAKRAAEYGGKMSLLEPFAAIGNSGLLVMLLPAVYLVLMSDFPKFDGNSMFYISRTGKMNWLFGQLLFALMSIVTYILAALVLVTLFSVGSADFSFSWSECTRFYAARFPDKEFTFASQLLPSNLYNQISLISSIVYTVTLLTLYLFLLTLILMILKLLSFKSAGLFASLGVIALGTATCAVKTKIMWCFPMANTIIWLHYTAILREPIVAIWYSYAYFAAVIIVLLTVSVILTKRANFIPEVKDQ